MGSWLFEHSRSDAESKSDSADKCESPDTESKSDSAVKRELPTEEAKTKRDLAEC